MKFYFIEPEVAGGFGKNTVFERTPGRPTVVHKLHYEFDGWLGDELLESTPCFIISERMAHEIGKRNLLGVKFDEVEVTTSGEFQDLHPERQLPKFFWLRVEGRAGQEDFGIASDARLVVSDRAIEVLRVFGISQALLTEFE